jgi:hypothetical protein
MDVMTPVLETYGTLPDEASVERTAAALRDNGMTVFVVSSAKEAKKKAIALIPECAEIMNMTSMTLETAGIAKEITTSGRYDPVRNELNFMDPETQRTEKRRLGTAPEWAIGSVHAVTEDGRLFIASRTGSQLPAYAYGAEHVLWVIGTQKIVENFDEALKRLYEYSYPLEDQRAMKAYGTHSGVSKILVVNKELVPGRITVLLVKEKLGF